MAALEAAIQPASVCERKISFRIREFAATASESVADGRVKPGHDT
jgi:hypothetical protein